MNYHHTLLLAPLICMVAAAETLDVHELQGSWGGRTALWDAAFFGRADEVKRMLAAGADPEKVEISERGITSALMISLSLETARLLVQAGADVNFVGEDGKTPLMGFLLSRPDAVRYLLEQGADPNARDKKGNTPLHHCTYSAESARLLIEAGADVNARNKAGNTPLMEQNGVSMDGEEIHFGVAMVRMLLRHGADLEARNNAGMSALDWAMCLESTWYGENPVLPLLQKSRHTASIHARLVGAATAGKVNECKRLLQEGADPNAFGENAPNALASGLGHFIIPGEHALELTKLFLAAGADPNLAASSLMHRCRYTTDREEVLELLFQHGFDLRLVQPDILRDVLVQLKDDDEPCKMLKMLQEHGAEACLDAPQPQDLRQAIENRDSCGIYRIRNWAFDMNAPVPGEISAPFADGRNTGGSPLILAAALGRTEAARILLGMKVDIHKADTAGRTALEYAAAANHAEVVQILLRAGATRIPQALQLAEQYGAKTTADILRKVAL